MELVYKAKEKYVSNIFQSCWLMTWDWHDMKWKGWEWVLAEKEMVHIVLILWQHSESQLEGQMRQRRDSVFQKCYRNCDQKSLVASEYEGQTWKTRNLTKQMTKSNMAWPNEETHSSNNLQMNFGGEALWDARELQKKLHGMMRQWLMMVLWSIQVDKC